MTTIRLGEIGAESCCQHRGPRRSGWVALSTGAQGPLTSYPGAVAEGAKLRRPPPWTGETRGRYFPLPGSAIVAEVHRSTNPDTDGSTARLLPSDVVRDVFLVPPTRGLGLSSMFVKPILIDLATDREKCRDRTLFRCVEDIVPPH